MIHRVQVTDTSQHQLFRGDCVNQAFIVVLLQINYYLKDTNKKKRLAWAKKHEQWTLDRWKSVLWSDESKCEIFDANHSVFVRLRVQSWPKVLRMTQMLIFKVCCLSLYDGNLHILQNVMKSDQMNCN